MHALSIAIPMLTCGRIHTIGLRRDSVFGLGGKSLSSCRPPVPRVMPCPLDRPLLPLMPLMPLMPLIPLPLWWPCPFGVALVWCLPFMLCVLRGIVPFVIASVEWGLRDRTNTTNINNTATRKHILATLEVGHTTSSAYRDNVDRWSDVFGQWRILFPPSGSAYEKKGRECVRFAFALHYGQKRKTAQATNLRRSGRTAQQKAFNCYVRYINAHSLLFESQRCAVQTATAH